MPEQTVPSCSGKENVRAPIYSKPTAASLAQQSRKVSAAAANAANSASPAPTSAAAQCVQLPCNSTASSRIPPPPAAAPRTAACANASATSIAAAQNDLVTAVAATKAATAGLAEVAAALTARDERTAALHEQLGETVAELRAASAERSDQFRRLFEEERQRTTALEAQLAALREQLEHGAAHAEQIKSELVAARHEAEREREKQLRLESDARANALELRLGFEQKLSERQLQLECERGKFREACGAHEAALRQAAEQHRADVDARERCHREEAATLSVKADALHAELERTVKKYEDQLQAAEEGVEEVKRNAEVIRESAAEKLHEISAQLQEQRDANDELRQRLRDVEAELLGLRAQLEEDHERAAQVQDDAAEAVERAQLDARQQRERADDLEVELQRLQQQQQRRQQQQQQGQEEPHGAHGAGACPGAAPATAGSGGGSSSAVKKLALAKAKREVLSLAEARQQHRRVAAHSEGSRGSALTHHSPMGGNHNSGAEPTKAPLASPRTQNREAATETLAGGSSGRCAPQHHDHGETSDGDGGTPTPGGASSLGELRAMSDTIKYRRH